MNLCVVFCHILLTFANCDQVTFYTMRVSTLNDMNWREPTDTTPFSWPSPVDWQCARETGNKATGDNVIAETTTRCGQGSRLNTATSGEWGAAGNRTAADRSAPRKQHVRIHAKTETQDTADNEKERSYCWSTYFWKQYKLFDDVNTKIV
jgi:hypothetical protein